MYFKLIGGGPEPQRDKSSVSVGRSSHCHLVSGDPAQSYLVFHWICPKNVDSLIWYVSPLFKKIIFSMVRFILIQFVTDFFKKAFSY